jgi:hypothetical protein
MPCIWSLSFGTEPVPLRLCVWLEYLLTKPRTGRFTIPTLVLLMLLIVLSAGPSRETLLPWLLFILTVMSFITVGVDEALPYLRRTNDDDNRSMRLGSERSTTVSTRPLPSNPRSQDPNDLRFITGPPSQVASRCSGSEGSSGINLHDVRGSVRPYWDESIRRFWRSQDVHVVPGSIPIEPSVQTMDIDQALDSQLSGISDDLDSGLSTRPFLHEPVQRSD